MKTHQHRTAEEQQQRVEADLEAATSAIFRRCPTLCGFAVRDAAILCRDRHALQDPADLFVTEISVFPLSGLTAPEEICNEIVATLLELIADSPETCELLRERSFARVFH